jgi:hypothetical protein
MHDTNYDTRIVRTLKQGDLIYPILFNILVMYWLFLLQGQKKMVKYIYGLILHLVEGGVPMLQYVDDATIFMEHNLEMAVNMKLNLISLSNYLN